MFRFPTLLSLLFFFTHNTIIWTNRSLQRPVVFSLLSFCITFSNVWVSASPHTDIVEWPRLAYHLQCYPPFLLHQSCLLIGSIHSNSTRGLYRNIWDRRCSLSCILHAVTVTFCQPYLQHGPSTFLPFLNPLKRRLSWVGCCLHNLIHLLCSNAFLWLQSGRNTTTASCCELLILVFFSQKLFYMYIMEEEVAKNRIDMFFF